MRVDCGQLEPGAVIRPVPGEWHPRMPERLDEEELAENFPFQRASLSLVDKGLVLIYLQRDPRFEDANLRALSGRACPRPDQAFLQRLIDYGIATGYLRGRTVQRTSGSTAPALCESRAPSVLRP